MNQGPIIDAQRLTAGYESGRPVVFDIELAAEPGDVVAVVGPNGCGKSTLLKALVGQLEPSSGTISIDRTQMKVFRPDVFRRSGVAYAPQFGATFDALTVEENLYAAAYQLPSRAEASRWVRNIIAHFPELESIRSRLGTALSGGERKILAFAMTLVPHACVLVLDEPAAGLSVEWLDLLTDRIVRAAGTGLTVIFAEQDLAFASRLAHRVYVMREGRVIDLLSHEAFVEFLERKEREIQVPYFNEVKEKR